MSDRKQTILLYVDDERANRVVFETSFGKRFPMRVVSSGREALEVLKDESINVGVVVTDQRMPEMSGHDLLVRVKELHPEIVRIVITAYSDLDAILRAVNDGLVARYVVKPWERTELEEILRWALEVHEKGREDSATQMRLIQSERLATLGSIAAAVLHDLHQPLAHFGLNGQRLVDLAEAVPTLRKLVTLHKDKLTPDELTAVTSLADEIGEIAEEIVGSTKVMGDMMGTMRQFVWSDRAKDKKDADPHAVVKTALTVCRSVAMRSKCRLVYEGPDALPTVSVGTTELTQVLINLVANGAQAVGARGAQGRVIVYARETPDSVEITVDDDGTGMPKHVLAKIGTPFFSTRSEGTGLGVAQCKRMIEGAKGKLTIDSDEGKGTRVRLVLPRAETSGTGG
ncbi:MAG: ATP-binding protein [Polyangiaceae bacterium]